MVLKPSSFPENINPNLPSEDFLYHLGFDRNGNGIDGIFEGKTLPEVFGDVTHICMGGSPVRAQRFAQTLDNERNRDHAFGDVISPIGKTERFSLHKIGRVISVSHGMGMPSMSILLHEITKMMYYAKGCDEGKLRSEVKFIRIGTSGGIGVEGGSVVITENARDPKGEAKHTETILGEDFEFPTNLNTDFIGEIQAANVVEEVGKEIQVVLGDTVGTDCFYEGQGRLDGFFAPGYSEENKLDWLKKLHEKGVRNFEMESTYFASFCLRAGIPAAIVCVALLNRFEGDQVKKNLNEISRNAELVVLNYLRRVGALIG